MAVESEGPNLLASTVVFLGAAVVAVPLFRRLGLGSVLGYLVAGAAIGPFGLRLIPDVESVLHFSEFGVVMLLFLIGLELKPRMLWAMRRSIVLSGGLQVLLSTALIGAAGLAMGVPWREAVIIAMALALSSTAIALSTMEERNLSNTPAGRTGFSVLLFQDIAVIPMIAFIPLLAGAGVDSGGADWSESLKGVVAIVAIVLIGHFLLRHVFRIIAASGVREIFTAFSLFLVCAIALLMESVGLSMALGTFLAGVLLAESEYRHAIETDIEPFKGLLLGLFFISVGMSINGDLLLAEPGLIALLVLSLVGIKFLVLWLVGLLDGVTRPERPLFGVLLSQGGEFAFVLFGVAVAIGALSEVMSSRATLVVALSMVTTPLLLIFIDRFVSPRFARGDSNPEPSRFPDQNRPVIVAGFGRFGQIIGRVLNANRFATTVIDHNPNHIERIRRFGYTAYYGDATRADLMHSAGAADAQLFVIATDNAETTTEIVRMLKSEYPNTPIVARAFDRPHSFELRAAGADHVVRETFVSALNAGRRALQALGLSAYEAHRAALRMRDYDRKLMEEQFAVRGDEQAQIAIGQRTSATLEATLKSDVTRNVDASRDEAWSESRKSGSTE